MIFNFFTEFLGNKPAEDIFPLFFSDVNIIQFFFEIRLAFRLLSEFLGKAR